MASFDAPADSTSASEPAGRAFGIRTWILVGLCALAAAAGAVIRVRAAMNDLWLDEIWSLHFAKTISSPLAILTGIHHDNNHYLNTFFLYLFRAHWNWPGFRSLSIAAGVGTILIAGLIGNRRSKVTALILMLLTAFSYVLVLYSSEARGYSLVVFFCLLSFLLLSRYLDNLKWGWAALFSLGAVLGFLSHLVFTHFYLAALAWSAYRLSQKGVRGKRLIGALGMCHAVPILFLAFLFAVDVRKLAVGGGTVTHTLIGSYFDALAWTLGTGVPEWLGLAMAITATLFLVAGIRKLRREKSDDWILMSGAIVIVPLVLSVLNRPDALYARYFIVPMTFLLVLAGYCLASLFERGGWRRALCVALIGFYFLVNGWHIGELFSLGRGQYGRAVSLLTAYSKRMPVTVGGDQDLRIGNVLMFYAYVAQAEKSIRYCPRVAWPAKGPEWVTLHKESFMEPSPPCREYVDGVGNHYDFVKAFPSAPLSGLHWFLYHNAAYAPLSS
jgi:hypothetical protein